MKSTNADDRCKAKDILDKLCSPERGLMYDFIYDWDKLDAVLLLEKKNLKQVGIAKIFSSAGKFGGRPTVQLDYEAINFMLELAVLMGKAAAVIVKFRDAVKYWKIDRELKVERVMLRNKETDVYCLPVNLLKNL